MAQDVEKEIIDSRLNYLKITEVKISSLEGKIEETIIKKNNAIASNQIGAKTLYEEQIKLATEQVNFYKSIKDKIVEDLGNFPGYINYIQNLETKGKVNTDIQMK